MSNEKTKVKLVFEITEEHTIVRKVNKRKLRKFDDKSCEQQEWLFKQFENDDFSDSEISTQDIRLEEWKEL